MKKISAFFSKKQTTIGSAAFVLMLMVLVSGVLGLVRWRVLNARFSPEETGIFLAAFRIPNLLFDLLAAGALTSAFIPVFTRFLTQKRKEDAHKMASAVINLTILLLVIIALPVFIFAPGISSVLAPGFSPDQIDRMAFFTRIMIVFQVVPLLIGNFFTGILQSYNLFIIPAIAPIVYNVGMIIGIVVFSASLGLLAPVVGVGIGAVLFLLIQVPLIIQTGYRHSFTISRRIEGVAEVGRLMVPRILGLVVSQIDITVDLMLSTLLGSKMVTVFYFAQSLQQLPVRLFGTTVAQAALPTLSTTWAQKNEEEFRSSLLKAIHMIFFFVMPISVLFMVLRIPIVRLLYGASRFDWEATVLTGVTLSMFSVSLCAQAISNVLIRAFYALYNSKTPVIVNSISVGVNTVLSFVFILVLHLPIWSLGLSTSIASFINMGIMIILLRKSIGGFRGALVYPIVKMLLAATITGVMLYIPLKLLDQLVFDTTRTFGLILLTGVTGSIGVATYVFLSWVLGVGEVSSFLRLLKKVKQVRSILLEPADEVTGTDLH